MASLPANSILTGANLPPGKLSCLSPRSRRDANAGDWVGNRKSYRGRNRRIGGKRCDARVRPRNSLVVNPKVFKVEHEHRSKEQGRRGVDRVNANDIGHVSKRSTVKRLDDLRNLHADMRKPKIPPDGTSPNPRGRVVESGDLSGFFRISQTDARFLNPLNARLVS